MQLEGSFRYLTKLHLKIGVRYIRKLYKEFSALIILLVALDTAGAGDIERSFPLVAFFAYCGFATLLQLYRKDKHFLRSTLIHYRRFLIYENLALCLPFVLVLLAFRDFTYATTSIALAVGISFIDVKPVRIQRIRVGKFLPANAFEWIGGVRQRFVAIILIYAMASLFWLSPIFPLIAFVLLTASINSFFAPCESYLMIEGYSAIQTFIRKKLSQALWLYSLFAVPIIIALLFAKDQPPAWVISTLIFFAIVYTIGSVLVKYAHFEEGKISSTQHDLRMLLLGASLILFPVTIAYEYHLYKKIHRVLPIFRRQ